MCLLCDSSVVAFYKTFLSQNSVYVCVNLMLHQDNNTACDPLTLHDYVTADIYVGEKYVYRETIL